MRAFVVVVALTALSCTPLPKPKARGGTSSSNDESAAEYQRRKARESGELDEAPAAGTKWGGWKYQGERDDCRYVYGRKCFTKRDSALDACKASRCKTKCTVDGGGPATVSCRKS